MRPRHHSIVWIAAWCVLAAFSARGQEQDHPQVNINTATEVQLAFLPGIGPVTASRIVAYRAKRPFRYVYQLRRVKGIGPKTLRRIKPYVTLKGPTTATAKIRPAKVR